MYLPRPPRDLRANDGSVSLLLWLLWICWPTDPEHSNKVLEKLKKLRSRLGVVAIFVLIVPYQGLIRTPNTLMEEAVNNAFIASVAVAATVIAWRLVTLRSIPSTVVPVVLSPLLRAILLEVLFAVAFLTAVFIDDRWNVFAAEFVLVCLFVFPMIFTVIQVSKAFGAHEAHPMLAPVSTFVAAMIVFLTAYFNAPDGSVPTSLLYKMQVCALATVSLLSLVEVVYLYVKGFRLRQSHWNHQDQLAHHRTADNAVDRERLALMAVLLVVAGLVFVNGLPKPSSTAAAGPERIENAVPPGHVRAVWADRPRNVPNWYVQQLQIRVRAPHTYWGLVWGLTDDWNARFGLATDERRLDGTVGDSLTLSVPGTSTFKSDHCQRLSGKKYGVACGASYAINANAVVALIVNHLGDSAHDGRDWWRFGIIDRNSHVEVDIADVALPGGAAPSNIRTEMSYSGGDSLACGDVQSSLALFGMLVEAPQKARQDLKPWPSANSYCRLPERSSPHRGSAAPVQHESHRDAHRPMTMYCHCFNAAARWFHVHQTSGRRGMRRIALCRAVRPNASTS